MTRLIIGLTGRRGSDATGYVKAQAGKDTAADHLVTHRGFARIALADGVRDALYALNPWIITSGKDGVPIRLAMLVDLIGWEEAKKVAEVRQLMQRMGTEAGRLIHGEKLWTDLVLTKIAALPPDQPVIIPDVRFPDEGEWVHSIGGTVVEVLRPDELEDASGLGENAKHASETEFIEPDHLVLNDASIAQLHTRIDSLVSSLP